MVHSMTFARKHLSMAVRQIMLPCARICFLSAPYYASSHTSKREHIPIDDDEAKWVNEIEGPDYDRPEAIAINEEEKHSFDDLLKQVPLTSREVIEHWLRWAGSYRDMAQAFDCD